MKIFFKVFFMLLIIGYVMLLCGCAREPNPITQINDGIQNSVSELTDYANHNMIMDSDKKLLLQGAQDCAARADAMTKTYEASIEKCATEKSKLKLERNGLGVILILVVVFMFRGSIRKFLHL